VITNLLPVATGNAAPIGALAKTLPHQRDLLTWCQDMSPGVAALLLLVGIIYLMYGYRIFKAVVMLNAAVVGAYIGAMLAAQSGEASMACAMIGAVAAAAITWPTMKYAVAFMGGIFGAMLGASIWRTVDLDPQLVMAGAMVGLVGFGMLSFILFRGSVMMYTSLQGAFMLVFGVLGLAYKYHQIAPQVTQHLSIEPFLLPAAIFVPTVVGLIYQQHDTGSSHAAHNVGQGKK